MICTKRCLCHLCSLQLLDKAPLYILQYLSTEGMFAYLV